LSHFNFLRPEWLDVLEAAYKAEINARTNPRTFLAKVTCPVLAIDGEKDLQVEAKSNLAAIRKTLEAHGNHLFQTAKTGLPQAYPELDETIAPLALKVVSDWVVEQVKP
jgi:fermentation-respiration switch protein FrsA (DUF1100 family)